MQIHFFNKGSLEQISGGHLYNKYLIQQLQGLGYKVVYYAVDQHIPVDQFLQSAKVNDVIVVDSLLVLSNLDFLLQYRNRFLVFGLIHLPQIFDPKHQVADLLPAVFEAERKVFETIPTIVTSPFCKEKVIDAFGLSAEGVYVLEPGVMGFEPKESYRDRPFRLINIATFDIVKGQDKIVNALAQLKSYDWVMEFYGNPEHDPAYYQKIVNLIQEHDLQDRVQLRGVIPHEAVNKIMQTADLLIQMSSFETYSMVIAEALASGLPFVSTRVGACAYFDQFERGIYLPDFNEWTLVTTLERLFESETTYQRLWKNEKQFANRSWQLVAAEFLEIVKTHKLILG